MSPESTVIAQLREEMPRLQERYGVRRLRVYGSIARGEETRQGYVDILIEFEKVPTLFDLSRIQEGLELLLGRRVDVTTPGGLHPLVRAEVQREGLDVEAP